MGRNTTWKKAEGRIASYFPSGKRRGADFRNRTGAGGKNDVLTTGWSVEVKHYHAPSWGVMRDAVRQAQAAKESDGDIPVAVVHKAGVDYSRSLVAMSADDFMDNFGFVPVVELSGGGITLSKIYTVLDSGTQSDVPAVLASKTQNDRLVVMLLRDFADRFINQG